ncbi:aldo/keto reductase [Pseudomonas sp. ER28]|uniref:aldo/keto reductase n=1 Tax=Pseudomonas sp. ER28 TaxID=3033801 RepID=UPI0023DFECC2|nr:aldo/keto reductase [Pseudomonas sp. ER28]MDF3175309.1 aldo/keto reductase [Pseudomonas sp. ER28]
MQASQQRKWSRSGIQTSVMGFGAAQLGNFMAPITEEAAAELVQATWDAGIRFFDTAPSYGHGLSEARLGQGLRWMPRDQFVLATKVGRLLTPRRREEIDFGCWIKGLPFEWRFDYSYDGTMRSIEDSLQRTGLEYIDVALIHEVDVYTHGNQQAEVFDFAMKGAGRALLELRDQGVVKSIGIGVNESDVAHEAIRRVDFDCLLLAGRYTLIEQDALNAFLPQCEAQGVSVIVGGGYNSGILATGSVPGARYNYAPAEPVVLERVRQIEAVCRDFNVPLKSAALQFIAAHPAVANIIPGVRSVQQLNENIATFELAIPDDFWHELNRKSLIRADAPTPASR